MSISMEEIELREGKMRRFGLIIVGLTLIVIPVFAYSAVKSELPMWSAGVFAWIICFDFIIAGYFISWGPYQRLRYDWAERKRLRRSELEIPPQQPEE